MLLGDMPAPSNPHVLRIRDEIQGLLQVVAVQQAESSASRQREAALEQPRHEREGSVHQEAPPRGGRAPARDCILDNRAPQDARHDINDNRRRKAAGAEDRGYKAHRGGRYDSDEDRQAPEPPGPRVFSRAIRNTPLPNPF